MQTTDRKYTEQCVVLSGPLTGIKELATTVVEMTCKDVHTEGYIPYLDPKMQLHQKASGPMSIPLNKFTRDVLHIDRGAIQCASNIPGSDGKPKPRDSNAGRGANRESAGKGRDNNNRDRDRGKGTGKGGRRSSRSRSPGKGGRRNSRSPRRSSRSPRRRGSSLPRNNNNRNSPRRDSPRRDRRRDSSPARGNNRSPRRSPGRNNNNNNNRDRSPRRSPRRSRSRSQRRNNNRSPPRNSNNNNRRSSPLPRKNSRDRNDNNRSTYGRQDTNNSVRGALPDRRNDDNRRSRSLDANRAPLRRDDPRRDVEMSKPNEVKLTPRNEINRARSRSRSDDLANRWAPSESPSESLSPAKDGKRSQTPRGQGIRRDSYEKSTDELSRKRDALRAQLESGRNANREPPSAHDFETRIVAAGPPGQQPLTPQTRRGTNDLGRRDNSDSPAALRRDISRDELRDRPRRLMSHDDNFRRDDPHRSRSPPPASHEDEETDIFKTKYYKVWKEIAGNTNMTLKRTASLEIYVPESVYEIVHADNSATIREIEKITSTKLKWEGLRDGYYNLKMTGPCLAIHSAHMILIQIIISQVTKEKELDRPEQERKERANKLLQRFS